MATMVCHGRRKGQVKSAPSHTKLHQNEDINVTANDLKNVTILSKADWSRIQYQLNKNQIEQDKIREKLEDKESRKNQSKETVKYWSNTIAGQRLQRLEARRLKDEAEEKEKQRIDLEEDMIQAQKRKEALEKAKLKQYYQSDRVKQFHGALLLTEVLKEREAQLELAKLQAAANDGRDAHYSIGAQRAKEEADLKDLEDARIKLENARTTADFLKAQINHHIAEEEMERKNDRKEGRALRELAMRHEMEKRQIDEIRHKEQQTLLQENIQQIEDVKRMKLMNKQLEDEEDDDCRQFAKAKRKMMILRNEKEKQLHIEKQNNLDKIKEKLSRQLQEALDDEDERIHHAIDDAEEKRHKEEEDKQQKVDKIKKEILEHTHAQMKRREDEVIMNRREDMALLRAKIEADELFRRNEAEKRRLRKADHEELKRYHTKQIDERNEKERDAKRDDKKLVELNSKLTDMEEEQFQDYAKRVIDHCKNRGRNTYPLRRAAREGMGGGLGPVFPGKGGVRPSYMTADTRGDQLPHYQNGDSEEMKKAIEGDVATRKRLGFVW